MFTFGIVCLVYIISVAYKCHFLYQSFIYFCLYRILRHGLEVTEMAVSELPGNPVSVWTARTNVLAEFDAYIIVSFINATLVLSIGETVEEVSTDSGFLGTTPTINSRGYTCTVVTFFLAILLHYMLGEPLIHLYSGLSF